MSTATLAPTALSTPAPLGRRPTSSLSPAPLRPPTPAAHLTRRGRAVVVLLLFLALAAFVAFAGRAPVEATSARDPHPVITYVTVHQGETLWQIAARIAPSADPRDTVDRIIEINGLQGGAVVAGRRLAVPAQR